jgi:hypothetical protein
VRNWWKWRDKTQSSRTAGQILAMSAEELAALDAKLAAASALPAIAYESDEEPNLSMCWRAPVTNIEEWRELIAQRRAELQRAELDKFGPMTDAVRVKALKALVGRFSQIEGYRCLSLMRALGVVKCQLALV